MAQTVTMGGVKLIACKAAHEDGIGNQRPVAISVRAGHNGPVGLLNGQVFAAEDFLTLGVGERAAHLSP